MHTEHDISQRPGGRLIDGLVGTGGRRPGTRAPAAGPPAEVADRAGADRLHHLGAPADLAVVAGAAVLSGVAALALSGRAAPWALLVALEVAVLGLAALRVHPAGDRTGRLVRGAALVGGTAATLAVSPTPAVVVVVAAAAMAWAASLLVALVGRAEHGLAGDALGLRRPALAATALVAALVAIVVPGVRPTAVAVAVGVPLAVLVVQLAGAGPLRSVLRRAAVAAALVVGAAAAVVAALVLGDPGDGAGPLVALALVLAVATALEISVDRRPTASPAPVVAVLLGAAAIGAAPGGLVLVGVALLAGGAWLRSGYPQPAPIPQLLIDLTDPPTAPADEADHRPAARRERNATS